MAGHDLVVRQASAVNEQCASCHLNVWAQFQKPNHHKLPEGAMTCVDCHNPHGSLRPAMMQSFGGERTGVLQLPWRQARSLYLRARPVRLKAAAPATSRTAPPIRGC